ncbi:sensor histidine kinase [Dokdonella sp.]|uniref:sensor histidine kinase n=1 Tax=Dokdonella sp. TaxID=2291710 RepID=UPI003C3EAA22
MAGCLIATVVIGSLFNQAFAEGFPKGEDPYRVLVLNSLRNSSPVNLDIQEGLVRGFSGGDHPIVEIDIESPHLTDAANGQLAETLISYFRANYESRKPQVLIATGTQALKYLLANGEALFPGVPIVFAAGVDEDFVASQNLPPNVTGITNYVDVSGTLGLMLSIHPDTERVALIIGAGNFEKSSEPLVLNALRQFEGQVDFIWLRGLPIDELVTAVDQLPERTIILYLVQFRDRNGVAYVPATVLEMASAASNVPIYGLWDTLLGHGIVGGKLMAKEEDGYQAALMALRILQGEQPASIPVVRPTSNPAIFDGLEMARWHIDEGRLPAGAQIRNRQFSVWEEYKSVIGLVGIVIVLQGLLIGVLLVSRRQRLQAEVALLDEVGRRLEAEAMSTDLRSNLSRFSKERSLGTMATAIAHEINQPLIAIQNYAQAVKRRLQADTDDKPKLIDILAKLEGEAGRAGEITRRIRNLVSRENGPLIPTSLGRLVEGVLPILEKEAAACGCQLIWRPVGELPGILADELEIQLVLVNLLHNSMESIVASGKQDKRVEVEARMIDEREVQVSVTDWGAGVPPGQEADLFRRLHSSKSNGMGMGLGIAEAIVAAHDGRIWYEPNPDGGAMFKFTLQAVKT